MTDLMQEITLMHNSGIIYQDGTWYMMCGDKLYETRVEFLKSIKRTPRLLPKGVKREPVI